MRFALAAILTLAIHGLSAQRNDNWVVGRDTGIHFKENKLEYFKAKADLSRNSNSDNGLSSISDRSGKLQLYTVGNTLYNKFHDSLGELQETITNIAYHHRRYFLPIPDSDSLYCIVYLSWRGGNSQELTYTLIDVSADNGRGVILVDDSSILSYTPNTRGFVYPIRHANKKDYWLIFQKYKDSSQVFLLSKTGISLGNKQTINIDLNDYTGARLLDVCANSSDSKIYTSGVYELNDPDNRPVVFEYGFNNKSGIIISKKAILNKKDLPYANYVVSMNTSFNDNYLYITCNHSDAYSGILPYTHVLQYDLKHNISRVIRRDKFDLINQGNNYSLFWTSSKAPNGKIYLTRQTFNSSDSGTWVIDKPNIAGQKCGLRLFNPNLYLYNPTIISEGAGVSFTHNLLDNPCADTAIFTIHADSGYKKVQLIFGDGDTAKWYPPYMNDTIIKHIYLPGIYEAAIVGTKDLYDYEKWYSDTLYVYPKPLRTGRREIKTEYCERVRYGIIDTIINASYIKYSWGYDSVTVPKYNSRVVFINDYFKDDTLLMKSQLVSNLYQTGAAKSIYGQCFTNYLDTIIIKSLDKPKLNIQFNADTLCQRQALFVADSSKMASSKQLYWLGKWYTTSEKLLQLPTDTFGSFSAISRHVSPYFCPVQDTFEIFIYPSPKVKYTVNDTNQCFTGHSFVLINKTDTAYQSNYYWGNGLTEYKNLNTYQTQYATIGHFNVYQRAINKYNCKDSVAIQLRVSPMPNPRIIAPNTICDNQFLRINLKDTLQGNFEFSSENLFLNNINEGVLDNKSGTYNLNLVSTSLEGCSTSVSQKIDILEAPKPSWEINDTTQCIVGHKFTILEQSNGKTSIHWGDGDSSSSVKAQHQYLKSGTFLAQLIKISNNGCSDTVKRRLTVWKNPEIKIGDSVACTGVQEIYIPKLNSGSAPIDSFLWTSSIGLRQNTSIANCTYDVKGNEWIKLYISDTNNCSAQDSIVVQVHESPPINFVATPYGLTNNEYIYELEATSLNMSSYQWDFKTIGKLYGQKVNPRFPMTGLMYPFQLKIASPEGCISTLDTSIDLLELTGFYFPNAFTPNDDGLNDEFGIVGSSFVKEYDLRIYNRLGGKVFETTDPNAKWNGKGWSNGWYVYTGYARDKYNRFHEFTGEFYLVR
jgi:gliding motility-associated-like protein